MGECLITRRDGGAGRPPASYNFLQLITSSLTWTVPTTGWYKMYCIGKSGNGGRAIETSYGQYGTGGSGGNSGGVAISELYLKAGSTYAATVTEATTSFGNLLSATSGSNGNPGQAAPMGPSTPPSAGVGIGYGGNLANCTGLQGGYGGGSGRAGDRPVLGNPGQSIGRNSGGTVISGWQPESFPGGGGAGADYQGLGKYQSSANKFGGNSGAAGWTTPVLTTPPQFCGSGGGAGGQIAIASYPAIPGGLGTPGGIIIEKGVA